MNHSYCICLILFLLGSSLSLPAQITYTVNAIDDLDDGTCNGIHCSLREAINLANNDEVASIIQFSFGNDTIRPASLLPPLMESNTTIDASTQSGIVLDGSHPILDGLIVDGNNMTIQGLKIINFSGNGIVIHNSTGTLIGGATADLENILSQNGNYGVVLSGTSAVNTIQNNQIFENSFYGVATIDNSTNNLLSQNSIYCNQLGGIQLTGGGNLIAPIINLATNITISGTTDPNHLIELFSTSPISCATDNFCQGKTYIGNVMSDGNGDWSFDAGEVTVLPGHLISATATLNASHTSEFSPCVLIADVCLSAYELPMNLTPCVGNPITADFTFANPSLAANPPMNACAMDYNVKDLWFKVIAPESGNLLIRHNSLDSVETLVEVYTGDCQSGLTSFLCDTLFQEPNILFITNQNAGATLYLRVWDAGNDDIGRIQLSAHELPLDLNQATICNGSDGSGERKPSDFIIQYKSTASPAEMQAVKDDLIQSGGVQLVDSCACVSPRLELWRVDNPIDLEDRAKGTRRKPAVDTVDYNYLIQKDDPITGTGSFVDFNSGSPSSEQKNIKVAIIDSGIEEIHTSLNENLWTNPEAIDGCVGNAPIGYDFKNGDIAPDDIDGHGTAVNGIVVLGIPGDIKLEIINGKFYQDGDGNLFDAVCAIHYAVEYGAKVINLSWGFKNKGIPQILDRALASAESQDILITTSAGNTYENNDVINKWPANADVMNIITVAAIELDTITNDTSLAPYSNYGKNEVHIAAMGFAETTVIGNTFRTQAGTSIAAPFVAQTAAIIRARYPNLSFMEVKDCILSSVRKIAVLEDSIQTGGVLDQIAALACANAKADICTDTLNLNLLETADNTYQVSNKITSSSTLEPSSNIIYRAEMNIYLKPGFQALAGSNFLAEVASCPVAFTNIANETQNKYITSPIPMSPIIKYKVFMRIYPNPTNDIAIINYEIDEPKDLNFKLFTPNGQVLKNWFLPDTPTGSHQFNIEVGGLPPGMYFLQLQTPSHSLVEKIIVKRN